MSAIVLKGLQQGALLGLLLIIAWAGWAFAYLNINPRNDVPEIQIATPLLILPSCKCNETI
jgi:hypothetical protein